MTHVKKKKIYKKKKSNKKKKHKKNYFYFKNLGLSLLISSVLFLIICSFFFSIGTVNGNSMKSALEEGQKVVIEKRKSEFKRFQIIAFDDAKKTEFRRIIGLPGDSLRYVDDDLYINEELVSEKFIINKINQFSVEGKVYTLSAEGNSVFRIEEIPENYYFVLGDNRDYSTDSRHYGLIHKNRIKGVLVE